MINSLIRRAIVCAGIVALGFSLVGQTALAKGKNKTKTKNPHNLVCTVEGDSAVIFEGDWVCESDLPAPTGLEDNDDGTVTDHDTGLMWEKKTGVPGILGVFVDCLSVDCPDPHHVNNGYQWTADGFDGATPNGSLYTDFLATLNLGKTSDPTRPCFANHCDWRVPNVVELRSILLPDCLVYPAPPCIHPIFGPTQSGLYWTSSSDGKEPANVWGVPFEGGMVVYATAGKHFHGYYVRAVRNIR